MVNVVNFGALVATSSIVDSWDPELLIVIHRLKESKWENLEWVLILVSSQQWFCEENLITFHFWHLLFMTTIVTTKIVFAPIASRAGSISIQELIEFFQWNCQSIVLKSHMPSFISACDQNFWDCNIFKMFKPHWRCKWKYESSGL